MSGIKKKLFVLGLIVLGSVFSYTHTTFAQTSEENTSSQEKTKKLKPTFKIKLGSFYSNFNTDLRVDSEELGPGTEFNLEDSLELNEWQNLFRIEGDFRITSRFQIELGYHRSRRSNTLVELQKDIQFGNQVFKKGIKVDGFFNSDIFLSKFKYSFILNETIDLGMYLGLNAVFDKIGLEGVTDQKHKAEQLDIVEQIPSLGIFSTWSILPKLDLNVDIDYFFYSLSQDVNYNQFQFISSLEYYFIRYLGLGVAFTYKNISMDADKTDFRGWISDKRHGFILYAIVGF